MRLPSRIETGENFDVVLDHRFMSPLVGPIVCWVHLAGEGCPCQAVAHAIHVYREAVTKYGLYLWVKATCGDPPSLGPDLRCNSCLPDRVVRMLERLPDYLPECQIICKKLVGNNARIYVKYNVRIPGCIQKEYQTNNQQYRTITIINLIYWQQCLLWVDISLQ